MESLGLSGRPSLAKPWQVNRGCTLAVVPVSIWPGVRLVDRPSTWQELQLPLPLNSWKPAISSAVRVTPEFAFREKWNFELKGLKAIAPSDHKYWLPWCGHPDLAQAAWGYPGISLPPGGCRRSARCRPATGC